MLEKLAKLWKCSADRAENILRSDERHAQLVLSRRAFFGATAALTAPTTTLVEIGELLHDPFLYPTQIRERVHQPFFDTLVRTSGNDWNSIDLVSKIIELHFDALFGRRA